MGIKADIDMINRAIADAERDAPPPRPPKVPRPQGPHQVVDAEFDGGDADDYGEDEDGGEDDGDDENDVDGEDEDNPNRDDGDDGDDTAAVGVHLAVMCAKRPSATYLRGDVPGWCEPACGAAGTADAITASGTDVTCPRCLRASIVAPARLRLVP